MDLDLGPILPLTKFVTWISCLSSLSLSFLIYEMEIMTPPCFENKMMCAEILADFLLYCPSKKAAAP